MACSVWIILLLQVFTVFSASSVSNVESSASGGDKIYFPGQLDNRARAESEVKALQSARFSDQTAGSVPAEPPQGPES